MDNSYITTLTNNYTLSIPKHLRDTHNLKPGQKFQIIELANKIEFIPLKDIKTLRGTLSGMDTNFNREEDPNE